MTNTPDYLKIRLGNLISMYLPGVHEQLSDTFCSVNTFRVVLRDYFGADLACCPTAASRGRTTSTSTTSRT